MPVASHELVYVTILPTLNKIYLILSYLNVTNDTSGLTATIR